MKASKLRPAMDFVQQAKQEVESLTPTQVRDELERRDVVMIIDVRESEELEKEGRIAGSVHAPRGMIEFYADPLLPYHLKAFDPSKRLILHCASGNRSALAVQTLKRMGYENVAHMEGGLKAWKEAGMPVIQ